MPARKSAPKSVKAHCSGCGDARNALILYEKNDPWSDSEASMWGSEIHRVLQCAGCDTVYFQKITTDSEDFDEEGPIERITYWPAPAKRKEPAWMWDMMMEDDKLHSLLVETYNSLNVDARVLAAIGLRTIFDRASEKLGIDPEKSFKAKLNLLMEKGVIGKSELDSLDILTDAGSAAAHRGWKPSLRQLDTLMNVTEHFIYRTFILSAEAKKLKSSIPARNHEPKPAS